ADIVVTAVVIYRDQACCSKSHPKTACQMKGLGRKAKSHGGMEMQDAAPNHPAKGSDHGDCDHDRHGFYGIDALIKKRCVEKKQRYSQQNLVPMCHAGKKKCGILCEANSTRSNGKRPGEERLPEKEEAHGSPQSICTEAMQQILIRTA